MIIRSPLMPEFEVGCEMPKAIPPKDRMEPRYLVTSFLMGEIYLKTSNIAEMTEMIREVQRGRSANLSWNGNCIAVDIDQSTCTITDFEMEEDRTEGIITSVTMSHAEFLEILQAWQDYVETFPVATH